MTKPRGSATYYIYTEQYLRFLINHSDLCQRVGNQGQTQSLKRQKDYGRTFQSKAQCLEIKTDR